MHLYFFFPGLPAASFIINVARFFTKKEASASPDGHIVQCYRHIMALG